MNKFLIAAVCLLFIGCGYTAEEKIEIEKEKQKVIKMEELQQKARIDQLGLDRVWCESLCISEWDGDPEMICTVNCVNALKKGNQIIDN